MEKEELKIILKSDIVNSEKVMEDFEYTFLDIKQVIKRIEWYRHYRVSSHFLKLDNPVLYKKYYHQRRYASVRLSYEEWLLDKAFEELKEASPDSSNRLKPVVSSGHEL